MIFKKLNCRRRCLAYLREGVSCLSLHMEFNFHALTVVFFKLLTEKYHHLANKKLQRGILSNEIFQLHPAASFNSSQPLPLCHSTDRSFLLVPLHCLLSMHFLLSFLLTFFNSFPYACPFF